MRRFNNIRITVAPCTECGPESLLDTVALGVQADGQTPYRLCARHLRELVNEPVEMERAVDQLLAERPPRETP